MVLSSIACIHTPGQIDFVRRKSSVYITVHEVQHTNAMMQKSYLVVREYSKIAVLVLENKRSKANATKHHTTPQ